jgi:hypothetical protein
MRRRIGLNPLVIPLLARGLRDFAFRAPDHAVTESDPVMAVAAAFNLRFFRRRKQAFKALLDLPLVYGLSFGIALKEFVPVFISASVTHEFSPADDGCQVL